MTIGKTPYQLAFSIEIVHLIEMKLPMIWTPSLQVMANEIGIKANLDTIYEIRDIVAKKLAAYQLRIP